MLPKAVMLAIEVTFPPESIFIIEVAPYLINRLPPDSTIEKLVVIKLEALVAVPVTFAVTVFAVKLPEASRATIVEAPLDELAVVLALASVPVDMLDAFNDVMFAPENVAELEPVPPLATGKTPNTLVDALIPVFEPVPPEATGRGVSNVNEVK
jgi:hypothetical protein